MTMQLIRHALLAFSCLALAPLSAWAATTSTDKVVVAGGGLTEIVYALGAEKHLVGVDTTSTWPKDTEQLPQIGYLRDLSAGGILSLAPTLLLTTDDAGPPGTIRQIKAAGVDVQQLPVAHSAAAVKAHIHQLAQLFDETERGEALIATIDDDLRSAQKQVAAYSRKPRTLLILSANGQLLAGGKDTAAHAMIELAGGRNILTYKGYKPLTAEAAVDLAPDVIISVDHVIEQLGGRDALLQHPALALTPAARNGQLVVMDAERLLGFGPRLGETVKQLAAALHGDAQP